MNSNWLAEHHYTMPNRTTYPWMWLWDSCFHAIIYAALDDERAILEANSVFHWQNADGMVPHMGYQSDAEFGRSAWRANGGSVISQPPMYGHMLRVLRDQGFDVEPLVERAVEGIRFFIRNRRLRSGLFGIVHPWESGADNSPRWDGWCPQGAGHPAWRVEKDRFVTSLHTSKWGSATLNPLFSVAPASFNALVAFNAMEIAEVAQCGDLRAEAHELAERLDCYYDEEENTWADTTADGAISSTVRTLDALLPALVSPSAHRVERSLQLTVDQDAFGAPYGPCGVDQREVSFDANAYWRGAAWPQLTYLLFVAASRSGNWPIGDALSRNAIDAALRSRFAEYLNPISGKGHGACPQSWACLPIAMIDRSFLTGLGRNEHERNVSSR